MSIIGFLGILALTAILLTVFYRRKALKFQNLYQNERSSKMSLSTNYGKTMEKFVPWMSDIFPYNPKSFRFIGDPIDGVVFGDDEVVFTEIKTGKSKLSKKQKRIKNMIENGQISWKEIRLD
ncbi:MAG: Holliday junction resolvase-like protein [Candidatus Aenigmatarchaeota archaeon]